MPTFNLHIQGASLALTLGYSCNLELAGVVSISGYLPRGSKTVVSPLSHATPCRLYHGVADQVVPIVRSVEACKLLKFQGVGDVELTEYAGVEHSCELTELSDIGNFIEQRLKRL